MSAGRRELEQSSQLQFLTSGNLTFRLEVPPASVRPQGLLVNPAEASTPLSVVGSSQFSTAPASIVAASAAPLFQPEAEPEAKPPKHRMSRAVKTVEALWREWTVGLAGNPSIRALDAKWGSQWRSGRQNELQWYSLRLEVIKEINRIAQSQRTSEEAAMWQVNLLQKQMRCSLDQLCKWL